jgi:transcriptional regulator with XRE-family HTH domain
MRSVPLKALRSATAAAVAKALAQARLQVGLTQRELAARLERPHSVIGMIESNQRQVNIPEIFAICDAMGVDPIALLKQVRHETQRHRPGSDLLCRKDLRRPVTRSR